MSICLSVRLCMDCLAANQIKEFVPYFNQYTIILLISQGSTSNMKFTVTEYLYIY